MVSIRTAKYPLSLMNRDGIDAWNAPSVGLQGLVVGQVVEADHIHYPLGEIWRRTWILVEVRDEYLLARLKSMLDNGIGLNLPSWHGKEHTDSLGILIWLEVSKSVEDDGTCLMG